MKPMSKTVKVDMLTDVYYTPRGPNFCPFRSTAIRFRVRGNGTGGATTVKPMSKTVNVDMLTDVYYYPEGPNFHPFRSTASRFRVRGNFSYSGHGTGGATIVKPMSKTVKVDMLTDVYYTPRGPNFRPFRSTISGLRVTAHFKFPIVNQWKILILIF